MVLPAAFVRQSELAKEIDHVRQGLRPEIVDLRYSLGEDHTGDPSIFFDIVLPDNAIDNDPTLRRSRHLQDDIEQALRPLENWGVLPYCTFVLLSHDVAFREKKVA